MNKNKPIWIILGAVVVIVACVILAGKYLGSSGGGAAINNGYTPPVLGENATSTAPTSSNVQSPSVSVKASSTSGSGATISVLKFYQGNSFSFNYPEDWTIFNPAPFSINNFKGAYVNGSVIPMGGAEIDVATTTLYSGRIDDIMGTELLSATNVVKSNVTVQGISCVEARYNNTYTPSVASRNIAVYCLRGVGLWKIYLSYRAGDSAATSHIANLNSVLASFKFLP